jgi:hypothetical protein
VGGNPVKAVTETGVHGVELYIGMTVAHIRLDLLGGTAGNVPLFYSFQLWNEEPRGKLEASLLAGMDPTLQSTLL